MTMSFPVLEVIGRLRDSLNKGNTVILQAPPGAGKSTVLPLQLLEEPWLKGKKMVMLEPRRLAARSVAQRMASMLNEAIGETVGYRIRFETKTSDRTRIEVVTEGLFLRMIQSDNTLENIGLVLFDEFHERSLTSDLSLALTWEVKKILRDDLRLLIMSATLDGEKIQKTLGQADIISSEGRQHPIKMIYDDVDSDSPVHERVGKAIRRALRDQTGDILVFLPGAGEIRRVQNFMEEENIGVIVCPLYGDLSFELQQQAILPYSTGARKVVLATSIAETSLTIEGITTVIDCGLSRVPRFDPRSGLTRLETIRVTKDAADQRAGRAGRLGPGICYRLWSEGIQQHLIPNRSPEILDADLSPVVLELAQWGVNDPAAITWITPPVKGMWSQAVELLHYLEALRDHSITERGKRMVQLPAHPRMAHMLTGVASDKRMLALAVDIISILEERDPMAKDAGSDLTLRIELLRRWRNGEKVTADRRALERIERLSANWRRMLSLKVSNELISDEEVGSLLCLAYPERVARQITKHGERYKLANGRVALLPAGDLLRHHTWLVIANLDAGRNEGRIFLAAPVAEEDLYTYSYEQHETRWDKERNMIVSVVERRIGNLILSSTPSSTISPEDRIQVLCDLIREKGLRCLAWEENMQQWQARVNSLRLWRLEEPWPDVSEPSLLEKLEEWLGPFLIDTSRLTDLSKLDLPTIVQTLIPWALQAKVDVLAPTRIEVPSGSKIVLRYTTQGDPPVLEVRLQEMFGMMETPAVNEGRNKVIVHLLSPGFKPVQVTQDLKSFWQNTYQEVRKELRTRYPKHYWPEDPWNAEAVRGVKRRSK